MDEHQFAGREGSRRGVLRRLATASRHARESGASSNPRRRISIRAARRNWIIRFRDDDIKFSRDAALNHPNMNLRAFKVRAGPM